MFLIFVVIGIYGSVYEECVFFLDRVMNSFLVFRFKFQIKNFDWIIFFGKNKEKNRWEKIYGLFRDFFDLEFRFYQI